METVPYEFCDSVARTLQDLSQLSDFVSKSHPLWDRVWKTAFEDHATNRITASCAGSIFVIEHDKTVEDFVEFQWYNRKYVDITTVYIYKPELAREVFTYIRPLINNAKLEVNRTIDPELMMLLADRQFSEIRFRYCNLLMVDQFLQQQFKSHCLKRLLILGYNVSAALQQAAEEFVLTKSFEKATLHPFVFDMKLLEDLFEAPYCQKQLLADFSVRFSDLLEFRKESQSQIDMQKSRIVWLREDGRPISVRIESDYRTVKRVSSISQLEIIQNSILYPFVFDVNLIKDLFEAPHCEKHLIADFTVRFNDLLEFRKESQSQIDQQKRRIVWLREDGKQFSVEILNSRPNAGEQYTVSFLEVIFPK